MSARPKAEIVAELAASRRAAGLVKATVWVRPGDRERLGRYVRTRLGGEYAPKPAQEPAQAAPKPRRSRRRPEHQHKLL